MLVRIPYGTNQFPVAREQEFQAQPFRCPRCKAEVYPQNLMEVACPECGVDGTKQHFSAVIEKKAA